MLQWTAQVQGNFLRKVHNNANHCRVQLLAMIAAVAGKLATVQC
jgi:hypothetical protein